MSMKNHMLLHRSGRNQFGDSGDGAYRPYTPSPEVSARHEAEKRQHVELNEEFLRQYGQAWLERFGPLKKKEVFSQFRLYGRPTDSTFYAYVRECASFEEFLFHWLLSNKRRGLEMLGKSGVEIEAAMAPFKVCGGWVVTYGKSQKRISGT